MRRGARHRDQACRARPPTSTAAAGSATRSPAMVTTSSSSFICPSPRRPTSAPSAARRGRSGRCFRPSCRRLGLGAKPDGRAGRVAGNVRALRGDDQVGVAVVARRRRRDSPRPRRSAEACSASTDRRSAGGRRAARRLRAAAPTWLANSQCGSTSSAGSPLISDTPLTSPGRSAWMMSLSIDAKSMTSREGIADLVRAVVEAEQRGPCRRRARSRVAPASGRMASPSWTRS